VINTNLPLALLLVALAHFVLHRFQVKAD